MSPNFTSREAYVTGVHDQSFNPREQTNRVIGTNALWTKKSLFGRQVFLRSNSPYHLMNEINLTHLTRQIWHPSQSRINWSLNWLKSSNAWLLGLLASQLAPLLKSLSKCLLCLKHLTHPFLHIHHCHCLGYIWLARLNPECLEASASFSSKKR